MVHAGEPGDGFWAQVEEELDEVALDAEIVHSPFYSEAEWDVFEVRYNGLGGYPLFAWLSLPRGDGPFPGVVQMPDYGSGVDIPYTSLRRHAVVLNASHRGQRRSDTPFQADYPGLLTHDIGSSGDYILKGVYADALRSIDLLQDQPAVDVQRMAAVGAGLGGTLALVAGAFRMRLRALAVDTPIMVGSPDALELADAYPLEEVNDYLRTYPHQRQGVLDSLEVFSPLDLARRVTCPVLLSVGSRDRGQCPRPLGEALARQLRQGELHQYPGGAEGGGHRHALLRMRWLRERLGVE